MKLKEKEYLDVIFRLTIVILTNGLLSLATVWFLEPAQLYAGGATGIAQLIFRLINICGAKMNANILGWFIFGVNVPIVLIGYRFVSKKFTIYSTIAVVVQSLIVLIVPASPFQALAETIKTTEGEMMNYGGILTLAIFGGLLAGIASGLALRFGVSTGGVDVIAQALSLRKGVSIGNFTMAINIAIACIGGGWMQGSWIVALFTIIRMILNSLVIDKIHTAYSYTALHIFSKHSEAIAHSLMDQLNRGCSLIQVEGAHSGKHFEEAYCVISAYEVQTALKIVKMHDEKAFITMSPVKKINGNFVKKTIV